MEKENVKKSTDDFTIREKIGMFLSKLSRWFVMISPFAFTFAYRKFFHPDEGLTAFETVFHPDEGIWDFIFAYIVIFLLFSLPLASIFRLSGGILYLTKGKSIEKSIAILNKSMILGENPLIHLELGRLYKRKGDLDNAIEHFLLVTTVYNYFQTVTKLKAFLELTRYYKTKDNLIKTKVYYDLFRGNRRHTELIDLNDVEAFISENDDIENYIKQKEAKQQRKKEASEFPHLTKQKTRYEFDGILNEKKQPSGQGIARFSNGDIYIGDFSNGELEGKGKYEYSNKDIYIGDFSNDKLEGKGKYEYSNKDIYFGEFKNDFQDGYGILTWTNGDSYSGFFKKGKFESTGTYLVGYQREITNCKGCNKYEGEWVNSIKHGSGKCYDHHDNIIYSGQFIKNYPVGLYPQSHILKESKSSQIENKQFFLKRKAFFSYSKFDKEYLENFKKHLTSLNKQGILEFWDDSMIAPGEEWNTQIKSALDNSDVVFLLLSSDFLATDYIWTEEISEAMKRHELGKSVVIPIKIRDCEWSGTPFSKLQGLPRKGPFCGSPKNDTFWREVVEEVTYLLKKLVTV